PDGEPGKAEPMEFLKTQLARVQEQFAQLTASQKMLAAALVVITVMSLYHWTTFAGKSEMEALFNAPMGADQTAAAVRHLQGRGGADGDGEPAAGEWGGGKSGDGEFGGAIGVGGMRQVVVWPDSRADQRSQLCAERCE